MQWESVKGCCRFDKRRRRGIEEQRKNTKGEEITGNMGAIVLLYVHKFQNYIFGEHNYWRKSLWSCLVFQIFWNFMSVEKGIQFIV